MSDQVSSVHVPLPTPTLEPALLSFAISSILENPDAFGEMLRSFTFDSPNGELGCYSTFETRDGFTQATDSGVLLANPLVRALLHESFGLDQNEALRNGVLLMGHGLDVFWYWDGDGTLAFRHHASGKTCVNEDCKKRRDWRWLEVATAEGDGE